MRRLPLLLGSLALGCSEGDRAPAAGAVSAPSGESPSDGLPMSMAGSDPASPPAGAGAAGSPGEQAPEPVDLVGNEGAVPGAAGDAGAPPSPPPAPGGFDGSFILGADISSADEAIEDGAVYVDTDGVEKPLLELLDSHGFNYIRLRTFVDPAAEYGYASGNGCPAKREPYADKEHTVAFARQIKQANMGFLLDFHYSDTWADPGKQVIPEAWRELETIDALAEQVRSYTVDVVAALVDAGARPDMVQVGNEITPGMLIHVPTPATDCYGNGSMVRAGVNGSQSNWDNLAALLRAGVEGVRSVDPTIQIMLHLENTESVEGVSGWVRNALQRGVEFDVLGLSAYEAFQGPSSAWRATLGQLAEAFPELSFAIAEYNPARRLLNDIMRELPDGRGLGTFFWEPTQSGSWGAAMFTREGNRFTANPADFAEYDQMTSDFGL